MWKRVSVRGYYIRIFEYTNIRTFTKREDRLFERQRAGELLVVPMWPHYYWSMKKITKVTFLLLTVMTAAVQMAHADRSAADRGAELLLPFKSQLKNALLTGIEQGPANAIGACRDEAPTIAANLSIDGVALGRSSHRLRNPANVAPVWVADVLNTYLQAESEHEPVALELPDRRQGYVEPIIMQPLCLTCHGENLSPAIAATIDQEYPRDEATGFEVGDLRGVFWVEFPAGKQ